MKLCEVGFKARLIMLYKETPKIRKRKWQILITLTVFSSLAVLGWLAGLTLYAEHQYALNNNTITEEDLSQLYKIGVVSYNEKNYAMAVINLEKVTNKKLNYEDAITYLILSYSNWAAEDSTTLAKLSKASEHYNKAIQILDDKQKKALLMQDFKENRNRYPVQILTFPAFEELVRKNGLKAELYNRGHVNSRVDEVARNTALASWFELYNLDPDYLVGNPDGLALNDRLADTFASKAVWLCQQSGNFAEALSAAIQSLEIEQRKKETISSTRKQDFVNLVDFIWQTQCIF